MQDVELFLKPISPTNPCGEDLVFSSAFDAIQNARLEDDPLLEQGEWVTERKIADWNFIEKECTQLLQHQSKDLRLSLWLCEALVQTKGFIGMSHGLDITTALISNFWEQMYPSIDDNDLDQRISLLQWFVQLLQKLPKNIGLNASGTLNFNDFEAAQLLKSQLDNNPDLYDNGLPDHKVTLDDYHEALSQTPVSHLQETLQHLALVSESWNAFKQQLDLLLGLDAPAFASVDQALDQITSHLSKVLKERGAMIDVTHDLITQDVPVAHSYAASTVENTFNSAQSGFNPQQQSHSQNRQQAMLILQQISDYFSTNEPHSPVSYLLKKTIKWANMPLHEWLAAVVKQEEPLDALQDMLGVQPSQLDS